MAKLARRKNKISEQVRRHASKKPSAANSEYEGNSDIVVSTGSTLLDLAISGGRIAGGGIPVGILVEIFGPSGSGKTVLLCEIAGAIRRMGGSVLFYDPEYRLNQQFAKLFDLDIGSIDYLIPDTVTEVFEKARDWTPGTANFANGIFTDSLAALSTNLEMEKKEGDRMGMRRAKEFSEELRKTCRIIRKQNILMVCSNQIRVNADAGPYGQKYVSPGGEAIGFYSSLRLIAHRPKKIREIKTISGKEVDRVIGIDVEFEVFKSSVWKPFRRAPVTIIFDYGIDDVRQNLQFMKTYTRNNVYAVGETNLDKSMSQSISMVEEQGLETRLKNEVVSLWGEIESKFQSDRKPKQR